MLVQLNDSSGESLKCHPLDHLPVSESFRRRYLPPLHHCFLGGSISGKPQRSAKNPRWNFESPNITAFWMA